MKKFTREQFTDSEGRLISEASDLEFPPGLWPYSFEIDDKLFRRTQTDKDSEGEITAVWYSAEDGTQAEVFND